MNKTVLSPAKLNLYLHITGQRADGYHDLQTVFRILNWGDKMGFVKASKTFNISNNLPKEILVADSEFEEKNQKIRLHCDIKLTCNLRDNLVIKAADALIDYLHTSELHQNNSIKSLPVIDIYLDKIIPTGAGLGGGSSNAATTLVMLNKLWNLQLTKQELMSIGTKLGADVPIFIYGQDSIAEGIGDILTPIKLPKQRFLLLTPSEHVSTAELFAHPKLNKNMAKMSLPEIANKSNDFLNMQNPPFSNVFEPVVTNLSPKVSQALEYLQKIESITKSKARMTGSGSCVYLPIPTIESCLINTQIISHWQAQSPCSSFVIDSQ